MRNVYLTIAAALFTVAVNAQISLNVKKTLGGGNANIAAIAKTVHGKPTTANLEAMAVKGMKPIAHHSTKSTCFTRHKAAVPTEMITEQPVGTLHKNLYRTSGGYYVFWGYILNSTVDGMANDVVTTDDGTLYFKNPLSTLLTNTWVKGTKGEGDTINVELPQLVYQEDYYGTMYSYYAWKMVLEEYEKDGELYYDYVPDSLSQTIKFVWRNDSLIKVGEELIGLGDEEGSWAGYGDYAISMGKIDCEAVTPAQDVEPQKYQMVFPNGDYEDASIVNVSMDGSDVYIAGLSENIPDGWVKGSIAGDKVTFDREQYLGVDTVTLSHAFFYPVRMDSVYVEDIEDGVDYSYWYTDYNFADKLEMAYDADAKTLHTDSLFLINQGNKQVNYMTLYNGGTLKPWTEVPATPKDPEILGFDDEYYDDYGYSYLDFCLLKFGTNGEVLDASKLYYNIYLDDELVTCYPDEYLSLTDELTDIPYKFSDGNDIYNYGIEHLFYLYSTGFDKIGVQLTYTGGGETHSSNIVYYDTKATGIHNAASAKAAQPVGVTYTDMSGRKVLNPSKGVYVKTVKFADGTVKSTKVVK